MYWDGDGDGDGVISFERAFRERNGWSRSFSRVSNSKDRKQCLLEGWSDIY